MDSITLYILICMLLLLFSATLVAISANKARHILNTDHSALQWSIKLLCLIAGLAYAILVYLQVLPLADPDTGNYRLSLGGAMALVGLVYVLFGVYFLRRRSLQGLSVLMFVAASIACIGLLYTETSFSLSRSDWALYLHLFLSLCAYACLSIAAVLTIIAPWQSRRLRKNPASAGSFFPSLESLDTETFKLIGLGFILLTVALLSGFFFLENMIGQHLPHKVILSLLSWLVFAILLLGRWRLGWRGKTAMSFALLGFFLLLLAYFGSKWVLEVLLQRSWS